MEQQKKRISTTTIIPGADQPKPRRPKAREILLPQEEQVLRMRYGIGMPPDQPLEFRGQENEETRIKLALLERTALEALQARRTPNKKEKIVKKLSEM